MEKYKSAQKARNREDITVTTVKELMEDMGPLHPRGLPEMVVKFGNWNSDDTTMTEIDLGKARRFSKNAWLLLDADTLGLSITLQNLLIVRRGEGSR